jgi:cobyrinic acid a,c-diamide synthase
MSIPRVLLVPTHRTGLADAVAGAVAEMATSQGQQVRYHHLGPISPASAWDRWEGSAFIDPALCSEEALLSLYDVATRGATLSLLSSTTGVLDRRDGVDWLPTDVASLLDCPVVVVADCRGWGTGIRVVTSGLRARLTDLNLAGMVLSGVAGRDHFELLREVLAEEGVPVVGCLFQGDGPGWDTPSPGGWGLPLDAALLDAVSRQVDIGGLISLAGQRGFLSSQSWLTDRGAEGPLIAVAGGKGFTPWSRDSIEVLRAAGAQVQRVDLLEDSTLPAGTAGLVLAGTIWPESLPDIAMNLPLLRDIAVRISTGLPTVAMGGGMLLLMRTVQDTLGRSSELAGVIPADGEILWDLEEPAYIEVVAERDSVLLARGEAVTGWLLTEVEVTGLNDSWSPYLTVRGGRSAGERAEGIGGDALLCSRVLLHLAAAQGMASRFVRRSASWAARNY